MTPSDPHLDAAPPPSLPTAIVGGGAAGLALQLALHQQGLSSEVFDARPAGAALQDRRTLALSHGSRQSLEWLGVWQDLPASPIRHIHISQQGGLGRTRLSAQEQNLPALGYVVPAAQLNRALAARCDQLGLIRHAEAPVALAQIHCLADGRALQFRAGDKTFTTALLAVAEGQIDPSQGRIQQRDYGQSALTCDALLSAPHGDQAWERFTAHGPVAVLPNRHSQDPQLVGSPAECRVAIVFTAPPEQARQLQQMPADEFRAQLTAAFNGRLHFSALGERHVFPLGLRYRQTTIAPRQVWLGNAAQTLHPVAGQGYNLALRDIRDLASSLAGARDPGDAAGLSAYARRRQLDRQSTIGFTDSLVRLFSNDHPLLHHARGAGLLALDLLPVLRQFVARRMIWGSRAW